MSNLQSNSRRTSSALMLKQLQKFAPAYYGAIKRELYSEKLSCDILLGSYNDITQKISSFDPKHSTLFAWGFRIVRKHVSMKKTELVLQEIFGCRDPDAYREQRQVSFLAS